jgi:hypothetical protein
MTVRPLHILLAAVALTVLNAAKPAVVDDTAYLLFARHLSEKPLDPYGWQLFWYDAPRPAMQILLPPVLPYWLAAGIRLFGEHLFLLKLWLFPFAWLLCRSVAALLVRFGAGAERPLFLVFVTSPAVLPLFNVMLDIPALALGAAALAVFLSGIDSGQLGRCALAGLLVGLAMQTKYSMLVTPVVMAGYAAVVGRSWRAAAGLGLAGVAALAVFGGWELYLVRSHDESHFQHQLALATEEDGGGLDGKLTLAKWLLVQFGGLACGLSLVAGRAAGWPGWVRAAGAGFVVALLTMVSVLPYRWTVVSDKFDAAFVGFLTCGASALLTFGLVAARLVRRLGWRRDTVFLLAWVAVEVVGMLGMTPFPAARRLVGVCLAFTVLVAHASVGLQIAPARWAVAFAVAVGGFFTAVDCWDAYPEKVLADDAALVVRPAAGETVWYTGHWGFQYYVERHGMTPIEPTTVFRAGDWLVLPVLPDDGEFYRPNPPDPNWPKPGMAMEPVAVLTWDDWLSAQTLPSLYGGAIPVRGRNHPRLTVAVYRLTADWSRPKGDR